MFTMKTNLRDFINEPAYSSDYPRCLVCKYYRPINNTHAFGSCSNSDLKNILLPPPNMLIKTVTTEMYRVSPVFLCPKFIMKDKTKSKNLTTSKYIAC